MVGSANLVSAPVLAEVGLGMLEGGHKYGRHNYRAIGVRATPELQRCFQRSRRQNQNLSVRLRERLCAYLVLTRRSPC
jgi:hypothetical protein